MLVAAIALWALYRTARRAVTILRAEILDGDLVVREGGIAPRLLDDLKEVARRARIPHATLRIERDGEHASLVIEGAVTDAQRQQFRNVVGSVPLAKLRNTRR